MHCAKALYIDRKVGNLCNNLLKNVQTHMDIQYIIIINQYLIATSRSGRGCWLFNQGLQSL